MVAMPRRNYVLLLRHCVRSTRSKIHVCGGDPADSNGTKRTAHLSEYIKAPLPEWDVPTLWCTERGMDIIRDLGKYLINDAINITSNTHVAVKIISDTHQRNVDTSLALLRGMKDAIRKYSFCGLDQISINHEVFGHTGSWPEKTCPSTSYMDQEIYDQISNRISRLPPSDFRVKDILDRIVSLGGLNESMYAYWNKFIENNSSLYDPRCPGILSLPLNLLESIAETALYSRASHIDPPFLPSATDEDVYSMTYVADYMSALEILDNKDSARHGLILARSMLSALVDNMIPKTFAGGNQELTTITVFVGHHSNINNVATALGLRWTMPPPYMHGSDKNVGKVVSIPPGSGIMVSSTEEKDDDLSISFVVPVNLIYKDSSDKTIHQIVPIHSIDMAQPEFSARDNMSGNGKISIDALKIRVEATISKYPDLRPCYVDAPIFLGHNDLQEKLALSATTILLAVVVAVNLIGYALLLNTRRVRSNKKYEQVGLDKLPEVELC